MPFIPNTPESLSTIISAAGAPPSSCCGVTNTGRPCNRVLKQSPSGAPTSGIIAVIADQQVFFCETHKDQASNVALRHTASFARRRELVGRGSMDTFIEQVELLVGTPGGTTTKTKLTAKTKRYNGEDPFKVAEKYPDTFAAEAGPPSPPAGYKRKQKQQSRKKPSLLRRLFCCCVSSGDEEYNLHGKKQTEAELRAAAAAVVEGSVARPARIHSKDKRESRVLFETTPPTPPLPMMYPDRKTANSAMAKKTNNSNLAVAGRGATPNSGIFNPNADPGTEFHSYIPSHLSESTQARLRAELSKPFSEGDEPGYIYIFWLTDSPISPSSTPGAGGKHTTAAALLKTATAAESLPRDGNQKPRLLLKIGRANNVQRRLHEWSTQCGYNLSLVRFYPHVSASATPSPAATPGSKHTTPLSTPALNAQVGKKVPNSHRIERLIHLELRDNSTDNPEIDCEACGKTHKEWFWVDASREGLRNVDEIVKKWIDYGEKSAMVTGLNNVQGAPMVLKATPKTTPKASPPKSAGTPKKSKKQDDPVTPTPLQKRPTLKDAAVGGAQGKKTPSSQGAKSGRNTNSSKNLSPNGGGAKRVSASPARSSRSNGGSRPGSSTGKGKSPSRGRGGGWKNYDENEGDEEYRPDQDE